MISFKVDTLISVFLFIVRQLLKTADRLEQVAQNHQDVIDKASAAKNEAVTEAKRAQVVAGKIQALLS